MATLIRTKHPEDIKAAIRKRYGSVKAFVDAQGLPPTSVSDLFRGRVSRRVTEAVEEVLQTDFSESNSVDASSAEAAPHRQNAGAR